MATDSRVPLSARGIAAVALSTLHDLPVPRIFGSKLPPEELLAELLEAWELRRGKTAREAWSALVSFAVEKGGRGRWLSRWTGITLPSTTARKQWLEDNRDADPVALLTAALKLDAVPTTYEDLVEVAKKAKRQSRSDVLLALLQPAGEQPVLAGVFAGEDMWLNVLAARFARPNRGLLHLRVGWFRQIPGGFDPNPFDEATRTVRAVKAETLTFERTRPREFDRTYVGYGVPGLPAYRRSSLAGVGDSRVTTTWQAELRRQRDGEPVIDIALVTHENDAPHSSGHSGGSGPEGIPADTVVVDDKTLRSGSGLVTLVYASTSPSTEPWVLDDWREAVARDVAQIVSDVEAAAPDSRKKLLDDRRSRIERMMKTVWAVGATQAVASLRKLQELCDTYASWEHLGNLVFAARLRSEDPRILTGDWDANWKRLDEAVGTINPHLIQLIDVAMDERLRLAAIERLEDERLGTNDHKRLWRMVEAGKLPLPAWLPQHDRYARRSIWSQARNTSELLALAILAGVLTLTAILHLIWPNHATGRLSSVSLLIPCGLILVAATVDGGDGDLCFDLVGLAMAAGGALTVALRRGGGVLPCVPGLFFVAALVADAWYLDSGPESLGQIVGFLITLAIATLPLLAAISVTGRLSAHLRPLRNLQPTAAVVAFGVLAFFAPDLTREQIGNYAGTATSVWIVAVLLAPQVKFGHKRTRQSWSVIPKLFVLTYVVPLVAFHATTLIVALFRPGSPPEIDRDIASLVMWATSISALWASMRVYRCLQLVVR